MTMGRAERERLDRLAGSGHGWGGGLPLPLLFAAMLNELLDKGSATTERMVAIAADKLAFKAAQIKTNQVQSEDHDGKPDWQAFTADVLDQMAEHGIIRQKDGLWATGPQFALGQPLVIIPARRRSKASGERSEADGVTVWEQGERQERNRLSHIEGEITSAVGSLRPDGPGLRPVDKRRAMAIRESVPVVGQLYPVLVDKKTGHILDGKHRREADPNWRLSYIDIDSDEMRLAVALWANSGQPLSPAVRMRIEGLIMGARSAQELQRDRIKEALLEYPELSHNAIAKRLEISDNKIIGRVCGDLIRRCLISECRHRLTEDGKQAPGPKPKVSTPKAGSQTDRRTGKLTDEVKAAIRAEVEQLLRAGEAISVQQQEEIGGRHGLSRQPVRTAIAEVSALLKREQQAAEERTAEPVAPAVTEPEAQAESEVATPEPVHEHVYDRCVCGAVRP
jgi:hypothetical protein